MKTIALALVVATVFAGVPLHAQVARVAPAEAPTLEKRAPTCPCDKDNFKPLNDKARAVAEYWAARRKYNVTSTIAGTAALFGLLAHDVGVLNDAENTLAKASAELSSARTKAINLDGIKVTDGDDKSVEIKLKIGVDYALTP